MPRLQPTAGRGELGPGEPMRGQLAAFPSGPSQDGLLLLASSREWSPTNPKFPHSLGNVASEGLRSRMSSRVQQGSTGRGSAEKARPWGLKPAPHSNRRGYSLPPKGWHSPHPPAAPHRILPATCSQGSHCPSFLFNQYTFNFSFRFSEKQQG